ncbi:MAG: hypothetical protein JST88_09205 [Bacteroidetes bacterium]|nr:hypothetical protein [Bacteroidota bacterium]
MATQIHALRDTTVPEQLMSIVAETMGLPYSGFTDRSRAGELVEMRTIAVAMIDAFTTTRTGEIGRLLGNRDHATIANMRQNIRDRIAASDEVFMAHYAACQKAITKWFDSQKNRKDEN